MDLFTLLEEKTLKNTAPLADRMRPKSLKDVLGQDHILGEGKFINRCIKSKGYHLSYSMVHLVLEKLQ